MKNQKYSKVIFTILTAFHDGWKVTKMKTGVWKVVRFLCLDFLQKHPKEAQLFWEKLSMAPLTFGIFTPPAASSKKHVIGNSCYYWDISAGGVNIPD